LRVASRQRQPFHVKSRDGQCGEELPCVFARSRRRMIASSRE